MTDAAAAAASSSSRARDSTPHDEQDREWPLLLRATDGRGKKDTKIKLSTTVRAFCRSLSPKCAPRLTTLFSLSSTCRPASSRTRAVIPYSIILQLWPRVPTRRSNPPTLNRSSRPTRPFCVRPSRADSDQRRRRATWRGNERSKRRNVKRPRQPQRELPSTRLRRPSSPVRRESQQEGEAPRTLRRGCRKWWDRGEGTGSRSEGG